MNRDKAEAYEYKVLEELDRFLSKDQKAVSATKIAGILGLSNMDSYAVKGRVEDTINRIIPEIEKEEGIKITDYGEYAKWANAPDNQAKPKAVIAEQDPKEVS